MRSDYIEKLKATHSSLRAVTTGTAQLIQVSEGTDGLRFNAIFNFHEGGNTFLRRKDGTVLVLEGLSRSSPVLRVLTKRSFLLKFDDSLEVTYHFVGNANRYVAARTIAGTYKDSKGRSYTFREDGSALYPDKTFKYEVGLDHVLTPYDYFWDKASKKIYAFREVHGQLAIFNTSGEMDESVEAKPFLSLEVVPRTKSHDGKKLNQHSR